MDGVAVAGRSGRMDAMDAAGASCRQMPLSFLACGQKATVVKVRGKGDLHHHLETLGFVEGAPVQVLSEVAGDLIVQIKGTSVALDRQVATRIITSAAT